MKAVEVAALAVRLADARAAIVIDYYSI